jgi:uracil-DNA glycosylase family 4
VRFLTPAPIPLDDIERRLIACRRCPRLVEWREQVATEKRAAFRDEEYWGRPVAAFGDSDARILVVGLAPAAHGANRTGRMFTGDRSGEWLYRALHRAGLANQPRSEHRDDGLRLRSVLVTAAVRCAPPANKPTPEERDTCQAWLEEEIGVLSGVRVFVALGGLAFEQAWRIVGGAGKRPRFAHLAEVSLSDGRTLLGSYHPSQQNTFTGKLTEPMFDRVWVRAKELSGIAAMLPTSVPNPKMHT